ncbi:putative transcription initiation factor IIB [environmental Halophage eHP-18]|nr:putative transcription initiation factor IIB [environmental Halophage eHP-17]AFH22181.1 putative transcription initiation factor IIB [environmental Halophage eHP-18]AFH22709.1 putative transcription initiation factor IIB [environmental Halophage eHP-33]
MSTQPPQTVIEGPKPLSQRFNDDEEQEQQTLTDFTPETRCPEPGCGGRVVPSDDETEDVCRQCGTVVDEYRIDHGPDWRSFDDDEGDARRAEQANRDFADRGLGSDRRSSKWNAAGRRQDKLQQHAATGDKGERARGYLTSEVHRMCCCLGVPSWLRDRAKFIARKVHEREGAKGKDLDTLSAAGLLAAMRENQYGRTAADIAEYARTSKHDIQRRLLWVCDVMGIHPEPPDPERRIEIVANDLGLDMDAKRAAREYYREIADDINSGTAPTTIAGLCCWWVGDDVTQKDVEAETGTTPTAIRSLKHRVDG